MHVIRAASTLAPMAEDPLHELERQVERGNLFAHGVLTEHAARVNESDALLNGLAALLVQRGVVGADELMAAVESARTQIKAAGRDADVGVAVRVDTDGPEPVIDCESRIPVCKAVCCRLRFALTVEEIESGLLKWELGQPYFNRQNPEGYCHRWDGGCTIYDDRPSPCRLYSCEHDDRIWKDFDAMELNQEWIDEHIRDDPSPVEIFMDAYKEG
jgi:hypothetical protein